MMVKLVFVTPDTWGLIAEQRAERGQAAPRRVYMNYGSHELSYPVLHVGGLEYFIADAYVSRQGDGKASFMANVSRVE